MFSTPPIATPTGPLFADLTSYGLIRAHGPDAASFLHGQFTNNVLALAQGHSQLNAYCNPKGRVLAIFRVFRLGDDYLLRLPRTGLEPVLKRLRMFMMRSKLTLEDASDAGIWLGYCGETAPPLTLAHVPLTVNDTCTDEEGVAVLRVPGEPARYEIFMPLARATAIREILHAHATAVDAAAWEGLDIAAGLPIIHPANVEAFVPQMLNLPALGGVDFKKGCYPGQEIVARMQYLGTLKRRMYLAHVMGAAQPQPGDAILKADETQTVGTVVAAQALATGGWQMLAVIEILAAEQHTLHWRETTGPSLRFVPLPYALPPAT